MPSPGTHLGAHRRWQLGVRNGCDGLRLDAFLVKSEVGPGEPLAVFYEWKQWQGSFWVLSN